MDCFRYMQDIYFESFEQFTKAVDEERDNMLKVNSDEINRASIGIDLDEVESLPDGRLDIFYENIIFESFFHYKENSKVLYVFLNGAITAEGATIPMFARWSYYKFMSGSMLNISDPMYRMNDKLKLGWYYGTKKIDLQQRIAHLTVKVADLIGVEKHNIIFVGSSGGGYASIACAGRISGAKSIAINPQIILHEYSYSKEFMEATGIDLTSDDKWHRNNIIYYLQKTRENKYLLFVNLRCESDMRQVKNICEAMNRRVKYGLNVWDNLIIWLYDADLMPWVHYHNIVETYVLCFLFEFIMNHNEEKMQEYDSWFRLTNEFYYDMRRNERYWRGKIPNIKQLFHIRSMGRKIGIFGLGRFAETLNHELFCIGEQNYYDVQFVIDNRKKGLYHGLTIKKPSEISNWAELFIIITSSQFHEQIRRQLEKIGLIYQQDFIIFKDLYQ